MNNIIEEAVNVINKGGIIIFPTDTAFGIGCRMDDTEAVRRLFALRERPLHQPTPILVASLNMAKKYAHFSAEIESVLLDKYWPGALTVIASSITKIDPLLQKNGGIGLRVPNNKTTLAIIEKVGVGILGPSANYHGKPTPYSFDQLDPDLIKKVDFVVPGECSVKKESTVVSTITEPWTIIRQGAVDISL